MANINMKINGNIQINVDDDGVFDSLDFLVDCLKAKLLSIQNKGWESVKGSETFTSERIIGGDVMDKIEVNFERI
jgi:hypothetical protein